VEFRLQCAYGKLGVYSRKELAERFGGNIETNP
jgi:hypothetical protein